LVPAIKDKELFSSILEDLLKATMPELLLIIEGGGNAPVYNDQKVVGGNSGLLTSFY